VRKRTSKMTKITVLSYTFLTAAAVLAQQPDAHAVPEFEAASIKPSPEGPGHTGWHSDPGLVTLQNQSLKGLVAIAWTLQDNQVEGGPKWMDSDRYLIQARTPGPSEDPQMRLMLQALLKDRFQLAFHMESKVVPGFALVTAKNGLKIEATKDAAAGSRSSANNGRMDASGMSMERLATWLARTLRSPVTDATGVAGVYDLKLEWDPASVRPAAAQDAQSADQPTAPSIFTALQDQLGLKLEPRKVSMQILVVDRAEKPSEN
jgi:uncharacterized protein (TIGR03435 family)